MDDIVRRGMARWPNVPSVFGWLGLDRRGQWRIKGDRIGNPMVSEFIGRNYARDDTGRWFFQNGPQRVLVELAYTPLVYRLEGTTPDDISLAAQTGAAAAAIDVEQVLLDEDGTLLVATADGIGLVDDRDAETLPALFRTARGIKPSDDDLLAAMKDPDHHALGITFGGRLIPVQAIRAEDVPARFGFVRKPVPPPGVEECY
jgi:hypothetical protein